MRAEFVNYRPKHDHRGAHVSLKHGDCDLLGTITHICPDEFLCHVQYFNGESWPINPALSRLEILERTYAAQES